MVPQRPPDGVRRRLCEAAVEPPGSASEENDGTPCRRSPARRSTMSRRVRVALPALVPALIALVLVVGGAAASPGVEAPAGVTAAAAVAWPPSTGPLVGGGVTGGGSASDEFVALYNAGPTTADLAGLEVVYVTSTGGTITRKATWAASTPVEPGRHGLLAHVSGPFASGAAAP